jgi:hypothetical protein
MNINETILIDGKRMKVVDLCNRLNCSRQELLYCISKVGPFFASIEAFYFRNKESVKYLVNLPIKDSNRAQL